MAKSGGDLETISVSNEQMPSTDDVMQIQTHPMLVSPDDTLYRNPGSRAKTERAALANTSPVGKQSSLETLHDVIPYSYIRSANTRKATQQASSVGQRYDAPPVCLILSHRHGDDRWMAFFR